MRIMKASAARENATKAARNSPIYEVTIDKVAKAIDERAANGWTYVTSVHVPSIATDNIAIIDDLKFAGYEVELHNRIVYSIRW